MTNITSHEHILFVLKGGFISESNLKHYKLLKCKLHKSAPIHKYLIMQLESII